MTAPQTWLGRFVPPASEDLPPKECEGGEGDGSDGSGDGGGERRTGLREGAGRGEALRRVAAVTTSASVLARCWYPCKWVRRAGRCVPLSLSLGKSDVVSLYQEPQALKL